MASFGQSFALSKDFAFLIVICLFSVLLNWSKDIFSEKGKKKLGTYYYEKTLLHHTIKKNWGWTLINMQLLIECYLLVFDLIFLFIVETYPSNQFRCIVRFSLMIDWHASICFSLCGKGPRNFPLWTRTRRGAGMLKKMWGQAYVALLQIWLWNLTSTIYPITSTTQWFTLKNAIE